MICDWCGAGRELELLEYSLEDRWFRIGTCCEGYYEAMLEELGCEENRGSKEWQRGFRDWFQAESGRRPRQSFAEHGSLQLDWGLEVRLLEGSEQKMAKAFIDAHHAHLGAPAGWRFGLGIWNGADLVGVCWVGNPVGRWAPERKPLEVNRLCIRRDLPAELRWNACSQAYAAAAREARSRGFPGLVTYIRADEVGASLKAVGWTEDATVAARPWDCSSRPRKAGELIEKRRFARWF